MPNLKKELALELYRHFDDLERYASGISEDSAELYADTEIKIRELIYGIAGVKISNDYKSERLLAELKKKIGEIRYNVADNILNLIDGITGDVIEKETDFWIIFMLLAFNATGKRFSKEEIGKIRKYGKYHGLTIKQIIEKVIDGDVQRIYEVTVNDLINGKPLEDVLRDIEKESNKTKRNIRNEVNAVIDGVSNDASLAFAVKNKTYLLYLSMLDDRVCGECSSHNGEMYNYNSPDIPYLPVHIRCRCHLIPVVSPESVNPEDYDVTFKEYFNTMNATEKATRIGYSKYAGYKSGIEEITKFVDVPIGARMSLNDMTKRDKNMLRKG